MTRLLVLLGLLLGIGMASLPTPSAHAGPAPGGPTALRLQRSLQSAQQHLIAARGFLADGNLPAMNVTISGGVADLQRVATVLAAAGRGPASEVVEAVLADLTTTDLTVDPELASLILERAHADLAGLLDLSAGVVPQSGAAGRIALNPPSAQFGLLCPNEERLVQIQVTNKSNAARTLSLRRSPGDPMSLTADSPTVVGANETVTLTVRFFSEKTGQVHKAVMLRAEAPGERDAGVFLTVTATVHSVKMDPSPVDFGEVLLGNKGYRGVILRHCDPKKAITVDLRFARGSDKAFTLAGANDRQEVIPIGDTGFVTIAFTPKVAEEVRGTLELTVIGDRNRREVVGSVDLRGIGKESIKVGARTLNFGTVAAGQFHTRTVSLENNTGQDQEVTVDRARLHSEYWSVFPAGKVKLPPNSVT